MMYKHQIDDCIERAREELAVYRKFGKHESVRIVEDRIASLRRIREKAPTARIGGQKCD